MKKLLPLAITLTSLAYANDLNAFQTLDNQVSLNVSASQGTTTSNRADGNLNTYTLSSMNLQVEHLFDFGLWGQVNMYNFLNQSQTANNGIINGLTGFGQVLGFNTKLGYNFNLISNKLSLTPYAYLGKSSNTTFASGLNATSYGVPISSLYFYNLGGGLRLEYMALDNLQIYLDQAYFYNRANPDGDLNLSYNNYTQNSNVNKSGNQQLTSALGIKYNPWKNLYLSSELFYNNHFDYNSGFIKAMSEQMVNNTGATLTNYGVSLGIGFTY